MKTTLLFLLTLSGLLLSLPAFTFCGFGTTLVAPQPASCSCPGNRVAIHKMGLTCEPMCVQINKQRYYFNQGWISGCCPALRLGLQEAPNFGIYPNPVLGAVTIEFNATTDCIATLRITDASGRLLNRMEQAVPAGANTFSFAVNEWSAGLYYLRLEMPGITQAHKFIISGQ